MTGWKPHKPFIVHSLNLRESDAWQSLSGTEIKVLMRIEEENAKHGGKKNGDLICPYRGFGIKQDCVKGKLDSLVRKGLIEMKRGHPGANGYGKAHRYRLTYLPTWKRKWVPPTNEWQAFHSPMLPKKGALVSCSLNGEHYGGYMQTIEYEETPKNQAISAPQKGSTI